MHVCSVGQQLFQIGCKIFSLRSQDGVPTLPRVKRLTNVLDAESKSDAGIRDRDVPVSLVC